jgi:transcriptional regulator with XRE-family HTH domain
VTLVHRHLDIALDTPPGELPLDALDDLLDRGDFDDWRMAAAAVRRDPHGELADRILWLCRTHPMYGTSKLWPEFISRLRGNHVPAGAVPLAELRRRRGRSQVEVARVLGISQSDVSKIERRADPRVSTVLRYVAALGGELQLTARFTPGAGDGPELPSTIDLDISRRGARPTSAGLQVAPFATPDASALGSVR